MVVVVEDEEVVVVVGGGQQKMCFIRGEGQKNLNIACLLLHKPSPSK
jgi:hypothetical protein